MNKQRINCELIITDNDATLVIDEIVSKKLLSSYIREYNKGKFLIQQRPWIHKPYAKFLLSSVRKFIIFIENKKYDCRNNIKRFEENNG